MKKLLLLTAVVLGAATASQAGVRFNFGFGIPLPGIVLNPAPVYQVPPVYTSPAPVYYPPAPAYCAPAPVYAPPTVYGPNVYLGFGTGWYGPRYGYWGPRYGYYGHYRGWGGHGWGGRGFGHGGWRR